MVELLQYKDVKNSYLGFQWTPIGEYLDEESANKAIDEFVEKGFKREDFKTREKVNREGRSYGGFSVKTKPIYFDMSASERKRRWDSDDPRDKI